jgi:hypothetical protein
MDENKLKMLRKLMSEGQVLSSDDQLGSFLEQIEPSRPSNMSDADWQKAKDIAKGNYPKDVEVPVKKVKEMPESLRRIKAAPSHQDFNSPKSTADELGSVVEKIKQKGGSVVKTVNTPEDLEAARNQVKVALEKQAAEKKPGKITEAVDAAYKKAADLLPEGKFAKLVGKLGKRGLKAIPIVGTGIGLADAARAAAEGDYKTAGLEALSAMDPTPLTDMALAAKDIAESQGDDSKARKMQALKAAGLMADAPMNPSKRKMMQADPSLVKAGVVQEMPANPAQRLKMKQADPSLKDEVAPMVDELGGEPDMKPLRARDLAGEQDSPDMEKMDNVLNYKDYLEQRKKLFGY